MNVYHFMVKGVHSKFAALKSIQSKQNAIIRTNNEKNNHPKQHSINEHEIIQKNNILTSFKMEKKKKNRFHVKLNRVTC